MQYRDESGKIHYVNTEYSKVPDRYRPQVEEQLRMIEEEKARRNAPPAQQTRPQAQKQARPLPSSPQQQGPVTNDNRLTRLRSALSQLENKNLLPPSVSLESGVISYIDKTGRRIFVSPDTLSSIPAEYYPQIDQQIINFEEIAAEAAKQEPFIAGTPVEVFVKTDCRDCTRLKILLQAQRIQHLLYDVDRDPQAEELYQKLGKPELPVTRIREKIIPGTNIGAIRAALTEPAAKPSAVKQ